MVKNIRRHNLGYRLLILIVLAIGSVSFSPDYFDFFGKEVKASVTRYYPNPATSFINFEFSRSIDRSYTLQLYSFTGRKMYETPVSAEKLTVNLQDFYRGVYFFQLRDRGGKIIETGKFQVVR